LLNVAVAHGPFFGRLTFSTRFFANQPIALNYLWKKDALTAKQLIQGVIICHQRGIKLANLSVKEITQYAITVGAGIH